MRLIKGNMALLMVAKVIKEEHRWCEVIKEEHRWWDKGREGMGGSTVGGTGMRGGLEGGLQPGWRLVVTQGGWVALAS